MFDDAAGRHWRAMIDQGKCNQSGVQIVTRVSAGDLTGIGGAPGWVT
jgi:hypothetical protein